MAKAISSLLLIVLFGCGRGMIQTDHQVHLMAPSLKTFRAINGVFHGECIEWSDENYRGYAVLDYTFSQGREFVLSSYFYLDSSCQIVVSEFSASGTLEYDPEPGLIYYNTQSAQFRVFGDELAIQYRLKHFCRQESWQSGEWLEITHKCDLAGVSVNVLSQSSPSVIDLYPCKKPDQVGGRCIARHLIKTSRLLR